MMPPTLINRLRLLRLKAVFRALRQVIHGEVLDVGGRDFFAYIHADPEISFTSWTSLELERSATTFPDERFRLVVGDGERMPFRDAQFDSLVNLQVLEHTMEPLQMMRECHRVLKQGGRAVFLVPQTSVLHEVPTHYYNFTRYFVLEAAARTGFTVVSLEPLGGRWSTHASHMFFFFLQALRVPGYSASEFKRPAFFYLLFPFMAVYAFCGILFGLLFSVGDLTEDPNNLLVILEKTN